MSQGNFSGRRVVLARYPEGRVRPSDFLIEDYPTPPIVDGEFLVRTLFISVDPMLRLTIDRAPMGGAGRPLPLGSVVPAAAVAEVVLSAHPDFREGDLVQGPFGWQDFAVSRGKGVEPVNPRLGPPENALGIAGHPGFTAYVGLHAGAFQPGQTVLVSGAAGAVGSVVGPLVRARGGRAVGIVGGAAKRRYLLEEAGYDAVADRSDPDFDAQLADALPSGADIYFDNVGGPLLARVVPVVAYGGLVLICGLMAQYQGVPPGTSDNLPPVLDAVLFKRVRIQGFSWVGQKALRPAFEQELEGLLESGRIASKIEIQEGLERLPEALVGLFDHSVAGKVLVRAG